MPANSEPMDALRTPTADIVATVAPSPWLAGGAASSKRVSSTPIELAKENGALTGLRAFAALWVLLLHAWLAGGATSETPWIGSIARYGWLGVDVFFALSGYLLAHQALTKRGRLTAERERTSALGEPVTAFLLRRVLRVYPAYYASLTLLLLLAVTGTYKSVPTVPDMLLHLGMVHNFDYVFIDSMNSVFWSLPFEWQFYLAFPALMYVGLRVGWTALAAAAIASALVARIWVTNTDDGFLLMQLVSRIDTFVVGMSVAAFALRTPRDVSASRALWMGGFAMLFLVPWLFASLPSGARYDGWLGASRTLWIDVALALLLLGIAGREQWSAKLFGNRAMLWLGAISYGIYLVHVPVLELLPALGLYAVRDSGSPPGLLRVLLVATPVVLALAALSHYAIEAPFQRARRRRQSASRAIRLLIGWATLLAIATLLVQSR